MGTNLGTTVMRSLPFGLPKVMVSTIASADTRPFIDTKDIIMVPSIADIAGLNRITVTIGLTTLGGTTACATHVQKRLEEQGLEGVIFHANGMGGKAMEELIEEDIIKGVFDLSTNEVVDHLYGGFSDAGDMRLEVAGRKGIPQLVSPGNIDHIMYSREDQIPERFKHQYIHRHGPSILVLRTKKKEMAEVGKVMAEKLNKAKGPTAVILPLKGFFESLSENLNPEIEIKRVDAHITDGLFAEEAAKLLFRILGG